MILDSGLFGFLHLIASTVVSMRWTAQFAPRIEYCRLVCTRELLRIEHVTNQH